MNEVKILGRVTSLEVTKRIDDMLVAMAAAGTRKHSRNEREAAEKCQK